MRSMWAGVLILWVFSLAPEARGQVDTLSTTDRSMSVISHVASLPSPTGALLRSTALPGWGQFYNRKPLKGTAFILLQAGLFAGVFLERDQTQAGGLTRLGNTLLLGLIGVRFYSMVDAYVDAHLADFDEPGANRRMSGRPAVTVGLRMRW